MLVAVTVTTVCAAPKDAAAELSTIRWRGSSARCIDLVIVAEGYTATQKGKFVEDADKIAEDVLDYGPYVATAGLVNVHALFVASEEPGADHPSTGKYAKTAFDATYSTGGIKRLLTANSGKVLSAVTKEQPDWDLALVLVNDEEYGGSGGAVPVVSVHANALAILRHELAHVVGGVADEYESPYPGKKVEDPEPNVALKANLTPLKWQHWVTEGTPIPTPDSAKSGDHDPIGAYEGARYLSTGMYRPTPNCIMRELEVGFCPVCWEAVTTGLAKQVSAVGGGFPDASWVTCSRHGCPSLQVDVSGMKGVEVRWLVDGKIAADRHATWWYPGELSQGSHEIVAKVFHASSHIRKPSSGVFVGEWTWRMQVGPPQAVTGADAGDAATSPGDGCSGVSSPRNTSATWWLALCLAVGWIWRMRTCESR